MNDLAQGVSKMRLWMKKDISGDCHIQLKTSEPTLNEATLTELLRLRMNSMNLQEGVTEIAIQLIPGDLPNPQLGLFQNLTKSELGLRAANRALARVCAEFGIEQVLIARCMNSHLPEESYQWKTFSSLRDHATQHQNYAAIVRRVLDQPRRISVPRRTSLQCTTGPYSIYGFWWRKTMIHRNYFFLENKSGSVQWVFYDHVGRQWYAQGFVQ